MSTHYCFTDSWYAGFLESVAPSASKGDAPEVKAACITARAQLTSACVIGQALDHLSTQMKAIKEAIDAGRDQ